MTRDDLMLLVVQFENSVAQDGIIKRHVHKLDIPSYKSLRDYLAVELALLSDFKLELMAGDIQNQQQSFEKSYEDIIEKRKFLHISIRKNDLSEQTPTTFILGRRFDVSNGFYIAGRALSVSEMIQQTKAFPEKHLEPQVGTGVSTWDASIVLAKYLEANPIYINGKTVLELGGGTGVAGMVIAHLCDDHKGRRSM